MLVLVAVVLGSLFYTVFSTIESQKEKEVDRTSLEGMLPEAVQWIQNFHRVEVKDGKKAWELEAEEAQYLAENHQVLVRKPRTTLYMKDGETVVASGDQGKVQIHGKELQKAELHDNVEVQVRGFVVRAGDAIYDRATDLIRVNGRVTIVGEQLQLSGNDMVVFVKDSRFELGRPVSVKLLPKAALSLGSPGEARTDS